MAWGFISALKKRRKERADVVAFRPLALAPVLGTVKLPAGCRAMLMTTALTVTDQLLATLTGATVREIKSPGAPIGKRIVLDKLERGVTVDLENDVDLYIDTGLAVWVKIARGAA